MTRMGGWTRAGSLATLTLAHGVSCQGAGHALGVPPPVADPRLPRPGPLARPPPRRPLAPAAAGPPLRPRPPHRHLLAARRRHRRGLPPRLRHRRRRRPPD